MAGSQKGRKDSRDFGELQARMTRALLTELRSDLDDLLAGLEAGSNGETTCWCFDLQHRMPMPTNEGAARCYCRACLERLIADQTASANTKGL